MLKRLLLSLGIIAGLLTPAYPAGSISLSLSQQFNSLGRPLNGGKLYFYVAGTTATPQSAYQDSALTIAYPNPITLDAAGRVPAFYLADGSIKIRLTDSAGVTQVVADNVLVVGASSGGGGGSSVDATTILATGDFKLVYNTGVLSGFVRCNGRTIGNATSGATERANADTSALFVALYTADTNLSVSGGRGASAAADYAANKALTLPDCRGRALAGLDDMGNSAASRLTATYWGASGSCSGTLGTTLGAACGGESKTMLTANLPAYTPVGSISGSVLSVFQNISTPAAGAVHMVIAAASGDGSTGAGNTFSGTFTGTAAAGQISTPFPVIQPTILMTFYIKL